MKSLIYHGLKIIVWHIDGRITGVENEFGEELQYSAEHLEIIKTILWN